MLLGERLRDRDMEAGGDLRPPPPPFFFFFLLLTAQVAGLENPNAAKKAKSVGEAERLDVVVWADFP